MQRKFLSLMCTNLQALHLDHILGGSNNLTILVYFPCDLFRDAVIASDDRMIKISIYKFSLYQQNSISCDLSCM
jgi:hypothetical protein